MPADENGDKWACEPCIRGHRSTRCEHWDRFMLRVKKPGRPLSSCPHPKNQCSCGKERVMMVRIPKASSCICAPAYSIGPDGLPLQSEISSDYGSPTSVYHRPTPHNNGAYRIQKPRQRTGSIIDPQAIARGFEADQDFNLPHAQPFTNNKNYFQPSRNDYALPANGDESAAFAENGKIDQQSVEQQGRASSYFYEPTEKEGPEPPFRNQSVIPPPARKQHSLGVAQESLVSTCLSQPWLSEPLDGKETTLNPICHRSCCGGAPKEVGDHSSAGQKVKKNKNKLELQTSSAHLEDSKPIEQLTYPPTTDLNFDSKINLNSPRETETWSHSLNSTTLYTIPPTCTTASEPLNPTQLAHLQHDSTGYSRSVPYDVPFGLVEPGAPSTGDSLIFNPVHNCNCGETCSCLGCAAHPYNATTRHHVQDLGHILEDGFDDNQTHSRPASSYENPNSTIYIHNMSSERIPAVVENSPSLITAEPHETRSPTDKDNDEFPTSVSISSNHVINPVYSSSSYYTMEFPMDDEDLFLGCTDVSGSCQCGSDCACIGCLTHTGHDGDPLLDLGAMPEGPNQHSEVLLKQEVNDTKISLSASSGAS